MSIVNNIKIVFPSSCEKIVHFRHAISLSENTLRHTYRPPLLQLRAPLDVVIISRRSNPVTYFPKYIPIDRRYNGTA
jgi:hypothetical protein